MLAVRAGSRALTGAFLAAVVAAAKQGGADCIAVSTFNGFALEYVTMLQKEMARAGLDIPVFVGGRLNQVPDGSNTSLPVDVGAELAESWHLSAAACLAIRHHHDYARIESGTELMPQAVSMIALGIIAERLYLEHGGDPPGAEWARAGATALGATNLTEDALQEYSAEIDTILANS